MIPSPDHIDHMILSHTQLLTEPMDGSFIQLLDTYTGLGPILDMAAVDLTRQGYDQVCACLLVSQYNVNRWQWKISVVA